MEFRSFGGGPIEKTLRLCGFARGLLSLDGGWESMGVDGSRWESMGVDGSRWEGFFAFGRSRLFMDDGVLGDIKGCRILLQNVGDYA
jgi:hypothetical protein